MFVISLASVSCLLVSGVLSLVLQLPQSTDGQLGDISRHFNFTTMLTSPTSPSNSSMNAREILCDKIFGSHMRPRSCLDALQYVPETPAQLSFGERGTGRPDIGLPYRFLSCKLQRLSSVGQIGHLVRFSDVSGSGWSVSD